MARLKSTPDGMVVAYCACRDGKRENLMPLDLVDGVDACLACGQPYTMARASRGRS